MTTEKRHHKYCGNLRHIGMAPHPPVQIMSDACNGSAAYKPKMKR